MNSEELIPFLQKCGLTESLSVAEIKDLLAFVEGKIYETDQLVFNEGDDSRELYVVKSGHLEVFKNVEGTEERQEFGKITEGAFFGEMAHLGGEKRSAAVKALDHSELLLINLDNLQKDKSKELLYAKVLAQLGKKVSQNLMKTDQTVIESLKEKLKSIQAHNHISKSLIHLIVLITVWFNVSVIIYLFPAQRKILDSIFTSSMLVLFALSVIYLIKKSGYPLSFYGITWNRWFHHSVEAMLYSILLMGFVLGLKWLVVNTVPRLEGLPVFASVESLKSGYPMAIVYFLLAPVQEFIARGSIQSTFRNFFQGPYSAFHAILVSNLLFQMVHTVKSFWLALASLFLGFVYGYLFEKQKSLVGVSLSHAVVGTWGFFILEFHIVFAMPSV